MPVNRQGSATVIGYDELVNQLLELEDSERWIKELAEVNFRVADFIVKLAKPRLKGLGGKGFRAAETLNAQRSKNGARLSLGGKKAPFAEGVEFGAHRNLRRIIKNTRGRATIVRDEENIDRVIGRVEQQSIEIGSRKNSKKAFRSRGSEQVKAVKVIRGWNQFEKWLGNGSNAGYALFPTMRENREEVIKMYETEIAQLTRQAFPD